MKCVTLCGARTHDHKDVDTNAGEQHQVRHARFSLDWMLHAAIYPQVPNAPVFVNFPPALTVYLLQSALQPGFEASRRCLPPGSSHSSSLSPPASARTARGSSGDSAEVIGGVAIFPPVAGVKLTCLCQLSPSVNFDTPLSHFRLLTQPCQG